MTEPFFFHAFKDGRIEQLTWNDYVRALDKRKDWLLGWATRKSVLLVKNNHSIGEVPFELIMNIQKKVSTK